MLRYYLKELISEQEFRENRIVTLSEVAQKTGVHRVTLSRLANHRGHNPNADVIDRLCTYFECPIEKLVRHIPDAD